MWDYKREREREQGNAMAHCCQRISTSRQVGLEHVGYIRKRKEQHRYYTINKASIAACNTGSASFGTVISTIMPSFWHKRYKVWSSLVKFGNVNVKMKRVALTVISTVLVNPADGFGLCGGRAWCCTSFNMLLVLTGRAI